MGWLEILPKEEGKELRETYIVYQSLERAFQRIRGGEYPPEMPSDARYRMERKAHKLAAWGQEPFGPIFNQLVNRKACRTSY